jgi:cGMP-dependent protein kinase
MREVGTLGPGKPFGELALVINKPRAATVTCIEPSNFITLDKRDFDICLAKIERKRLNKMLNFMRELPCFKGWTHTSILKFSYYLKKEKFSRN